MGAPDGQAVGRPRPSWLSWNSGRRMAKQQIDLDDLTPDLVRVWGYDEDLVLLDQDEDLMLYDVELIPVLVELSADSNCPKKDMAYYILCQFCREAFTHRGKREVNSIREVWSSMPNA